MVNIMATEKNTATGSDSTRKPYDAYINLQGFGNIGIHYDSFADAEEFVKLLAEASSQDIIDTVVTLASSLTSKASVWIASEAKPKDKPSLMQFLPKKA